MGRHDRFVEDPEDLAKVLDTLSDKIPKMIRGLMDSFFSPEAAANIAKSVAEFRKNLIEGGISEGEAMEMTREYLRTLTNWQGMMSEARKGKWHHEEE